MKTGQMDRASGRPGILLLLPVTPLLRRGDASVAVFSSLELEAVEPALRVVLVRSDPPARLRMRQNRTCDGKWLPAPSVTVLWRSFYFQVVGGCTVVSIVSLTVPAHG